MVERRKEMNDDDAPLSDNSAANHKLTLLLHKQSTTTAAHRSIDWCQPVQVGNGRQRAREHTIHILRLRSDVADRFIAAVVLSPHPAHPSCFTLSVIRPSGCITAGPKRISRTRQQLSQSIHGVGCGIHNMDVCADRRGMGRRYVCASRGGEGGRR